MKQKANSKSDNRRKAAIAAAALSNKKAKKKVKVVEVKLSKKVKSARSTTSASSKKKTTKKAKSATQSKQTRTASKPAPKQPKLRLVEKIETTVTPENNLDIYAPTLKVLKPFRDAAIRNRKRAQEVHRTTVKSRGFLAKPLKAGKKLRVDLRVHSPGTEGYFSVGGIEPGAALVRLALAKNLDMIGLTDYYNASFVDAVKAAAIGTTLTVLPGFDFRCRIAGCNEVTLSALFPETSDALQIFTVLQTLRVPSSAYGNPSYVLTQDIQQIVEVIETSGGLIIPSRLDKTPYCQLAIRELIETFGYHAFDLVHPDNPEFFKRLWPNGEFTFFSFSNANALGQVGSRQAKICLPNVGFAGLQELVKRRNKALGTAQ